MSDIKVGGFYLLNGDHGICIEYVTKITENTVHYEVYRLYDGFKIVLTCDSRYYTQSTRPISPAEIFLRYGNDLGIVEWIKEMKEQYGQNK